jgi:hypothetical protein
MLHQEYKLNLVTENYLIIYTTEILFMLYSLSFDLNYIHGLILDCNNLENGNWFTKISKINYNKNDPALIFITKCLLKRFQTESYTYTLK